MPSRLWIAVALTALLCGCGKQDTSAFNASYDKNFMASCTAAATKGVMTATMARDVCQCAIDGVNRQYTVAEKLVAPAEKLKPIMMACVNKMVQR